MPTFRTCAAGLVVGFGLLASACQDSAFSPEAHLDGGVVAAGDQLAARFASNRELPIAPSREPALVTLKPGFENVRLFPLVASTDTLPESPSFRFGGSADGAGLLKNPDGTFTFLVNHEDNFSVTQLTLDAAFRPLRGQYLLNSDGGRWRLCSATMATPEEHGFGPLFLTVGESNNESQIHALNPYAMGDPGAGTTNSRLLPALGRHSSENALPLPTTAFPGKTVVAIMEDESGTYGGQFYLYISDAVGDLDNGKLYVMARRDNNTRERDMVAGQRYEVEFREVENPAALTGAQMDVVSAVDLKGIAFGRIEDADYAKDGKGSTLYFNVTGQADSGTNADYSRSKYGRVYRLNLSPNNPLRGSLTVLLDGDDRSSAAGLFQNPDNILATENYLYIQEDPNGYGDETHDAYIYQYNLRTGALQVVLETNRALMDDPAYNQGSSPAFGSWEYGALLDVSKVTGVRDLFMLAVQPHTWRRAEFQNPDGGSLRPSENQGSQILVLQGLPR